MESMSKKEKLARGSAVIKVMKVIPRAGRYLKTFMDVHKLPRKVKQPLPRGVPPAFGEMPYLFVREANFGMLPKSAKANVPNPLLLKRSGPSGDGSDPCKIEGLSDDEKDENGQLVVKGFPNGHPWLRYFGYREWANDVYPTYDGNIAEHFNILLGLLMSMAVDPENQNFPDVEAYPCVQFLKTIQTPNGVIPDNTASFISYLDYICVKIAEEN